MWAQQTAKWCYLYQQICSETHHFRIIFIFPKTSISFTPPLGFKWILKLLTLTVLKSEEYDITNPWNQLPEWLTYHQTQVDNITCTSPDTNQQYAMHIQWQELKCDTLIDLHTMADSIKYSPTLTPANNLTHCSHSAWVDFVTWSLIMTWL